MALATIRTDEPEYEKVQALRELWDATIGELIQSDSAAAVEAGWEELQSKLTAMGMDEIESLLTQRYMEHEKDFLS